MSFKKKSLKRNWINVWLHVWFWCAKFTIMVHIHTLGRFNNHAPYSFTGFWSQHQCHGDEEIGNSMPRAGIKPTLLEFQANVLTNTPHRFPDITTLPHAYVAPCLRGQCRLLQYYESLKVYLNFLVAYRLLIWKFWTLDLDQVKLITYTIYNSKPDGGSIVCL